MGKTAMARCIGYHAARQFLATALQTGKPAQKVVFFTAEMRNAKQAGAYLTAFSGVRAPRKRGPISEEDARGLIAAAGSFRDLPIVMDDTPRIPLSKMKAQLRKLMRQPGGVGLVILDYLQLMGPEPGERFQTDVQRITGLSAGLKGMAGWGDFPLIALSQLSRAVEQREDKRPQLSDLRESGAIEQDADVVGLVYREQYYLERDKPEQRLNEKDSDYSKRVATYHDRLEKMMGKCEVNATKVRLGEVGRALLDFDGPRMWFSDPNSGEQRNVGTDSFNF